MIRRSPVLTQQIVEADGTRRAFLRVFCDERARSVPFEHCMQCVRAHSICRDPHVAGAFVECRLDERQPIHSAAGLAVAELADGFAVGTALSERVLCVRPETSRALVLETFTAEPAGAIVVTAPDGSLSGIVWRREAETHARGDEEPLFALDLMRKPPRVLDEGASLREAVFAIVRDRIRFVPVITGGRLSGAITDLDLLRWYVRQRAHFE